MPGRGGEKNEVVAKQMNTRPHLANMDRKPYALTVAKCFGCAWTHTAPQPRREDVRKAAKKHSKETGHDVWVDWG